MRTHSLNKELLYGLIEQNRIFAKSIRQKHSATGKSSSDEAYALITTILKILHPKITDAEIEDSITDGQKDGNIDAVYIPTKQGTNIEVFDCKSAQFDYREIKMFVNHVKEYIFGANNNKLSNLNSRVFKKIKEIKKKINKGHQKIDFYVCRASDDNVRPEVSNLGEQLKQYDASVDEFHTLNEESLVKKIIEKDYEDIDVEWTVEIKDEKGLTEGGTKNIKTLIGRISLDQLVKLKQNYDNKKWDLFEKNVRVFQRKKGLSSTIINTLNHNPLIFYIFHNGLTFIAESIKRIDDYRFRIKNPQIINGCQTVNTLYEAYRKNEINQNVVKKANVFCRFYALTQERLIEKICQSTNTQLKIGLEDLRSNDEVQKVIEKLFEIQGDRYIRKRNPQSRRKITLVKLAQWINSCKFREPADSKNKRSELFDIIPEDSKYRKIFNGNLKPGELYLIAKIGKFVDSKIGLVRDKKTYLRDVDLHLIAGMYFLDKTKSDKLEENYEKTRKVIEQVIKKLRKKYGQDYTFNKIFTKNKETWKLIKNKLKK